jgi:outer membrane protein OmpA-like peptidoglycan-associated protein
MIFIIISLLFCLLILIYLFLKIYRPRKTILKKENFLAKNRSSASHSNLNSNLKTLIKLEFDFILFDKGMSHLNKINQENLLKVIGQSAMIQTFGSLEIMGLADQSGDKSRNENLAKYRGLAVYNFLIKNGFPKDNLILLKYQVVNGNSEDEKIRFRSVRLSLRQP